jgi:hypothetical protein
MGLEEIAKVATYGELLGTGTLSTPPSVEIPLTRDVLAGESAF